MRRSQAAVVAAVAALVALTAPPALAIPRQAPTTNADQVLVRVLDVTPTSPRPSSARSPLRITVALTNLGDTPLPKVELRAERGDPIGTQVALTESMTSTATAATGLPVPPTAPTDVALQARGRATMTFATTTSLVNDGKGLCLCHNQVYPLVLSAHAVGADGTDQQLGVTTTYLSAIDKQPANPVQVAWVWPLIDRPHRLVDTTVFTDDELTATVGGGRLDRALQVVEQLPATVPMSLVIDPELLDELEVMATGTYTVQAPGAHTAQPGTGGLAATAWLRRLAAALAGHPSIAVSLTPYGDPDIATLSDAKLTWETRLPALMAQHVTQALFGHPVQNTVAWPPSGSIDKSALTRLAASGVTTVVLDSSSVSPSSDADIPASHAQLRTGDTAVGAALTAPGLQALVARAVLRGGSSQLPALTAEIAVRGFQDPGAAQSVVLTPPRYVDPDVAATLRTINDTSTNPFSTAVPVTAIAAKEQSAASRIRNLSPHRPRLPSDILNRIGRLADDLPALQDMLAGGQAARPLLTALPSAIQRLGSAAWRPDVGSFTPGLGAIYADAVDSRIQSLLDGVHIVKPSSGSYTLASSTAQLPITVENTSPYPVNIKVNVFARDHLPGFTSPGSGARTIDARAKSIIQVSSQVERSGRIPVQAQLQTPNGTSLGPPVALVVHSTIFGTIGIVITVAAGGVLALALLIRFGRRVRLGRKRRPSTSPPVLTGAAS